jgi:hypothetical protein
MTVLMAFLGTDEIAGVEESGTQGGCHHHWSHVSEIQHQGFCGYNEPKELKDRCDTAPHNPSILVWNSNGRISTLRYEHTAGAS